MQTILLPTDFSSNAQNAAAYAISLFGTDANYTLINTYEVPHSGATMLISIADILEKDSLQLLNEEQKRLIEAFPEIEGKLGVKTTMGAPDVAIGKIAEAKDVVVMGTKGATGLKEVFVGSVAANTLTNVSCPVIAVPDGTELISPKRIVFAADDTCLAEGKLPEGLVEIANRFNAEVLILNVVPQGEGNHVGNSAQNSREAVGVFEKVKHSIHFVENDDVKEGIASFIEHQKPDMLAMVTRRGDFFARLFGLSETKAMMMHANVPLAAFH